MRKRWLATCVGLLVLLALFAARPVAVLGVNGNALARSVVGGLLASPCEKLPDNAWKCSRYAGLYDPQPVAVYRVEVHALGCWSATRIDGERGSHPTHRSGCITALTYFFG